MQFLQPEQHGQHAVEVDLVAGRLVEPEDIERVAERLAAHQGPPDQRAALLGAFDPQVL